VLRRHLVHAAAAIGRVAYHKEERYGWWCGLVVVLALLLLLLLSYSALGHEPLADPRGIFQLTIRELQGHATVAMLLYLLQCPLALVLLRQPLRGRVTGGVCVGHGCDLPASGRGWDEARLYVLCWPPKPKNSFQP